MALVGLAQAQQIPQNFATTQKEIIRSRSTMLSYILKLKKCIDARHVDLLNALTKRFSESAIDYISYGHFRLFQEYCLEPHQSAALDSITKQILDFDARYSNSVKLNIDQLRTDLETLALALETRFEIEDEFLALTTA